MSYRKILPVATVVASLVLSAGCDHNDAPAGSTAGSTASTTSAPTTVTFDKCEMKDVTSKYHTAYVKATIQNNSSVTTTYVVEFRVVESSGQFTMNFGKLRFDDVKPGAKSTQDTDVVVNRQTELECKVVRIGKK